MKALFNDQILNMTDFTVPLEDRAFQYGDGLFETIALVNGVPRYLQWHIERLSKGLSVLDIDLPKNLSWPVVKNTITTIISANSYPGDLRIKIQVWRNAGGLYQPQSSHANYLITCQSGDFSSPSIRNKVSFSKNIRNHFSTISAFKSMSALKYVLAGVEMKKRSLDDIIILDVNGYISECLASNIFWIRDDQCFTSDVSTGCIDGIMRRFILEVLPTLKIPVQEGFWQPEELLNANAVFTSNASGIQHILQIDRKRFLPFRQIEKIIYGR